MKWIKSNGKQLDVREVSSVLFGLAICDAGRKHPLPILDLIEDDDKARARLKQLLATGFYEKTHVQS